MPRVSAWAGERYPSHLTREAKAKLPQLSAPIAFHELIPYACIIPGGSKKSIQLLWEWRIQRST